MREAVKRLGWLRALAVWAVVLALVACGVPGGVRAAGTASVSASITSPTRSDPATVRPGGSVKVTFRYLAAEAVAVEVALVDADDEELAVKEVDLAKATSSRTKSVTLTVPSEAEPGKYWVVVRLADGTALDTKKDAVLVAEDLSLSILSPTEGNPATVEPGEEVEVELRYTSAASAEVEVRLVGEDDEELAAEGVTLSKATNSRRTTVSLEVPSTADPGEYDLVVIGQASGAELAREEAAVVVETELSADIDSPTRYSPAQAAPGGLLTVELEYRAGAATEVQVRIEDSLGEVVAKTTATLRKAISTRSASVSLTVPSGTAAGSYDLVVARPSGAVLDRERAAVKIAAPTRVEILSPTAVGPVRVAPGGEVQVYLSYSAPSGARVRVSLVKADGSIAGSVDLTLSAGSGRTTSAKLTAPAASGSYGLRVTESDTGEELDYQRQAVVVATGALSAAGKSVRLVVGTAGRWVDGTFQTTDCAPVLREGRVFLPIRHVGEPLGWSLAWEPLLDRATVTRGDLVVKLYLGKRGAEVSRDGGKTWEVTVIDKDNPKVWPFLDGNRVMLPLGFVAAHLGAKVSWDGKTRSVTVEQ